MVRVDAMYAVGLPWQVGNIKLGESTNFIANSNKVCSLSWERQLPCILSCTSNTRKCPRKKNTQKPYSLGTTSKKDYLCQQKHSSDC